MQNDPAVFNDAYIVTIFISLLNINIHTCMSVGLKNNTIDT